MTQNLEYSDYLWDPAGRGFRQRDLTVRAAYDPAYLQKYRDIDDRVRALATRRVAVLGAFAPPPGRLIDFGCGSGRVVEAALAAGWDARGYDLVPGPEDWRVADPAGPWDAACFFDSLEHCPEPDAALRAVAARWVIVSVPWCHHPYDPVWFMGWKHRRPGEHLWHWGRESLDDLFAGCGYRPVAHSSFEDFWRPNPAQAEPNILTAVYARAGV